MILTKCQSVYKIHSNELEGSRQVKALKIRLILKSLIMIYQKEDLKNLKKVLNAFFWTLDIQP